MHRRKMSRGHSRSVFRKGMDRVHRLNFATPMRGGFRL